MLRAIRITKGTRYNFMGTIYFVGHYFYRDKWNGQNCERVYGTVLFAHCVFKKCPQRENGWNFLEMAGKSAAGIRKMKDFSLRQTTVIAVDRFCLAWFLISYQTSGTHNAWVLFSIILVFFFSLSFYPEKTL